MKQAPPLRGGALLMGVDAADESGFHVKIYLVYVRRRLEGSRFAGAPWHSGFPTGVTAEASVGVANPQAS